MYCIHALFGISYRMDYPIQTPQQLSSHLRALRKVRGLSQQALGRMLGVGQTRIARIESDPTAVSVEQFIAMLSALNTRLVLRDAQAEVSGRASSSLGSTARAPAAGGDATQQAARGSPKRPAGNKPAGPAKPAKQAKSARLVQSSKKRAPPSVVDGEW